MLRLPPKTTAFGDYKHVLPFYGHTKNGECLTAEGKTFWNETMHVDTSYFSNLHPSKCVIGGIEWDSTEHYFQMYKYSEGDRNFMTSLTTGEVAMYGQVPPIVV